MEYRMRDRAMRRRDMRRDRSYGREIGRVRRESPEYEEEDYGYDYNRNRVPFEVYGNVDMRDYARRRNSRGQYMRDGHYDPMYMRDYAMDEDVLSDRELMEWSKDLLSEVQDQYKSYFTIENIENKAKEKGIEFKNFTPIEFYTTVLMQYTDFGKTLGTGNMDLYLSLAKDWLCDEDSGAKYGEKLARYYDEVIMA